MGDSGEADDEEQGERVTAEDGGEGAFNVDGGDVEMLAVPESFQYTEDIVGEKGRVGEAKDQVHVPF